MTERDLKCFSGYMCVDDEIRLKLDKMRVCLPKLFLGVLEGRTRGYRYVMNYGEDITKDKRIFKVYKLNEIGERIWIEIPLRVFWDEDYYEEWVLEQKSKE